MWFYSAFNYLQPILFDDFLAFLQKSFKVGNGPRGSSWLQSSPLQLSAWQILTTNWTTHVHHPFSPCMDPQFQSRGHQGNLSWNKCQMMSDVFLMLQLWSACVVAENSLSNFLVRETNSQRESLGASAVSRPCFLTCRNKEARFGTRIPESIEGKQRNAPPKKR